MDPVTLSMTGDLPQLAMSPVRSSLPAAGLPGASSNADFGSVLQGMLGNAAQSLRQGEAAALAGIQGTMPVQDVVEHVMAAERTLQTAIGIRDKFVSAYLEISRMQI